MRDSKQNNRVGKISWLDKDTKVLSKVAKRDKITSKDTKVQASVSQQNNILVKENMVLSRLALIDKMTGKEWM